MNILYKTFPKLTGLWVKGYLLSVSKLKSVQSQEKKKILMLKMLQITESISWNKESALQSQAMENTAWHYLSTKMEPLGLYLSTCNKAGFNGVQSQHVLLFWHLNLEMRGTLRVHHFPDALHQESRKDLKRPDCTERLKHGHGTAALPNSILCPDKTKAGSKVTECWWWQPSIAWFAFRRLRWGHHTAGTAKGWRSKPRNGDFPG